MSFDNLKIIKKLGAGDRGAAYLVEQNNKKYALKIQHILPETRKKSFQTELWRELDLYEYINKLNKNDSKFFTKLHAFEIYNNCKHIQKRPFSLGSDPWSKRLKKLDKSDWCVKFLLEYKGKNTFEHYLVRNSTSVKRMRSFLLQIIKINLILSKGGYCHNDLNNDNIMINPTKEKYFTFQGKKILYYGYQLTAIDYGEVLHKKFKLKNNDNYKTFNKDIKKYIFEDLKINIENIISNLDKYMFMCKKKQKKMPWEKDPNNLFRTIMNKHCCFYNETKRELLKIYPNTEKLLNIIEKSNENYLKIIEKYEKSKKVSTNNIFIVINGLATKFSILHPRLYAKYFGWCSSHKWLLPNKYAWDLLKVNNMKNLIKIIIDI